VDIGRVIIHGDGPDTSFIGCSDEESLRAPAMAGALPALARLTRAYDGHVWLVSKCGAGVQKRTRAWLAHHSFYKVTGIREENLRFCKTRPEKAPICEKLGITCFIDDRLDILDSMRGKVPALLWFGESRSRSPRIVAAPTWAEAEAEAMRALRALSSESAESAEARQG
jgi:hypothetical protein